MFASGMAGAFMNAIVRKKRSDHETFGPAARQDSGLLRCGRGRTELLARFRRRRF
jgi:hypothetical protein